MAEVLQIRNYVAVLNYGVNRVRFPAPLPVGAPVRGAITLMTAREREPGNVEATFAIRYEMQGTDRPPCVAETVYLYR
jgi:acyl dehydratase